MLLTTTAAAIPPAAAVTGEPPRASDGAPDDPRRETLQRRDASLGGTPSPDGLRPEHLCRDTCGNPEQRAADQRREDDRRASRPCTSSEGRAGRPRARRRRLRGRGRPRAEARSRGSAPRRPARARSRPLRRAVARSRHGFRERGRRPPRQSGVVREWGVPQRSTGNARCGRGVPQHGLSRPAMEPERRPRRNPSNGGDPIGVAPTARARISRRRRPRWGVRA